MADMKLDTREARKIDWEESVRGRGEMEDIRGLIAAADDTTAIILGFFFLVFFLPPYQIR